MCPEPGRRDWDGVGMRQGRWMSRSRRGWGGTGYLAGLRPAALTVAPQSAISEAMNLS
ncbi:Uncharacterised protein [Bordetella pertussis]|nr:Uncharacterised protein [Bordetella pertussis]CFW38743.1 Uncharacterised protein [Bordetella pertussis]